MKSRREFVVTSMAGLAALTPIAFAADANNNGKRRERREERKEERRERRGFRAAHHHLEQALRELEHEPQEFGGHRAKALDLVKDAIKEVEEAVKFDAEHERERKRTK